MTPAQEADFERKAEKMLAGHRLPPNGRNVFAWKMRFLNNTEYREKFDDAFEGSPLSDGWYSVLFCDDCGMRRVWCECKKK